ncbi:hypothetical protein DL98DRAFT_4932 [Cadophora sp. DSE1049]|nr:hypothetical protein DL98DRAFT_4932 [Cadophora sp. DSE1049]
MTRRVVEPAFSTQLEETDEDNRAFDGGTEWSLGDAWAARSGGGLGQVVSASSAIGGVLAPLQNRLNVLGRAAPAAKEEWGWVMDANATQNCLTAGLFWGYR